jgi:hypothetical protein
MRRTFVLLVGLLLAGLCAWAIATAQGLLGGTLGGLLVGLGLIAWADDRERRNRPSPGLHRAGTAILALVAATFVVSFLWRGLHILMP